MVTIKQCLVKSRQAAFSQKIHFSVGNHFNSSFMYLTYSNIKAHLKRGCLVEDVLAICNLQLANNTQCLQ